MVVAEGLGKGRRLLEVNLRLEGGRVGLLGPNGAGKSTLLALLAGHLRPSRGWARLLGHDPRDRAALPLRAYLPQGTGLLPHLRVGEVLEAGQRAKGLGREALEEAIERLGLERLLPRRTEALSGGERRRVALALALMGDPPIWLLDEPTAALDPRGRKGFWAWVAEKRGLALTTLHEVEEAQGLDLLVLLKGGRVLEMGPPQKVLGAKGERLPWLMEVVYGEESA